MTNARIAIPSPIKSGDVIEIKTLITHPMETGLRYDSMGQVIPRNIITQFECRCGPDLVFKALLNRGIAANPYLSFFFEVVSNCTLEFTWQGDKNFYLREVREIRIDR